MIAITGLGAVSCLGPDVTSLLDGLWAGQTGLAPPVRFDPGALPPRPVGEVAVIPGGAGDGPVTHRLATAAAREAVRSAALDPSARTAVVVGTTTGGIEASERWFLDRLAGDEPSLEPLRWHPASTIARSVARAVGAGGPQYTVSTACSSGANAIAMGADLLGAGLCDAVVAGGADSLCRLTWAGFASLRLMSDRPCRPFAQDRSGLSLGEAGAFVVMERAGERAIEPHAYLLGSGCTCDAHHMTAPAPGGEAVVRAIRLALNSHAPGSVGYVNAHATATRANDAAEAGALRAVFGDREMPPVSASKSLIGHTLGAAGAIEAVISILAVREGLLPPTANTVSPDPTAPPDLVLGGARAADVPIALSTSFAFGGNNAALLFGRAHA